MDIEKKKKKICSCHEKCSYCIVTSFSIESATVIAYLSEKISISNGALVITSARHCDQAQFFFLFVQRSGSGNLLMDFLAFIEQTWKENNTYFIDVLIH